MTFRHGLRLLTFVSDVRQVWVGPGPIIGTSIVVGLDPGADVTEFGTDPLT